MRCKKIIHRWPIRRYLWLVELEFPASVLCKAGENPRSVEPQRDLSRLCDQRETPRFVGPNVRAKREPTAGRQARGGENVPRTTTPGLVACRWLPLERGVLLHCAASSAASAFCMEAYQSATSL